MIHNLKGILYTSLKFEQYLFMYQHNQKLYIYHIFSQASLDDSPLPFWLLCALSHSPYNSWCHLLLVHPTAFIEITKYKIKSHTVLENCRNWSRPVLFINQMCVLLMMSHFNNTTSTCTVYVHTDEQDIRNYNVQYSSPLTSWCSYILFSFVLHKAKHLNLFINLKMTFKQIYFYQLQY